MAYIKQVRAIIPSYLLSYIFNWDREKIEDTLVDENDTPEDLWKRERLYMEEANTSALISAFRLANESIEITKEKAIVLYIVSEAKTNLKIGDEIINIDGVVVHETNDLTDVVSSHQVGDKLTIKVLRNDKEIDCYAEVINLEEEKKVGVALIKNYEYKTNRKVKFNFDSNEAGPSGGLMISLEIYNQLTSDDITKGEKIAGTGTIDENGKVGTIGGVKYKLKGAESDKAKVFFVPSGNYDEAIKEKKEHNYKIEVIKVETIDDAINYLKGMN
jgi:PDZ domain-containing protein